MSNRTAGFVICTLLFSLAGVVFSAEESVFSGPQPGEKLPPLPVVMAYGSQKGKQVDFVAAAGRKPSLLVFVRGANRPAARLTRVLMNYAEMCAGDKLSAAVVWLDGDRSAAQRYLARAVSWWGVGPPVGISIDGAEGPGSYGLNRNVNVTVLVADKNRVTANFALVQPSETDAPKILAEVVKLIGGDVPTKAEVVFLSLPTRKPPNAKWHTAPRDVIFRRLVCNLLAAQDNPAAMKTADAIGQYVHGNAGRKSQLSRLADILGKGRTKVGAIPAKPYLRRWRTKSEKDGGHYPDAHKPIREGLREAIDKVKNKLKPKRP